MTPSEQREEDLLALLRASSLATVLPRIAELGLADWWLAGGAVRNTVWDARFGCQLGINDLDVAFFDLASGEEVERAAEERLRLLFPTLTFDVKNQASFGRWRPAPDPHHWAGPYHSTEDGIADWLHTATAVGVRVADDGHWCVLAAYGLDDLLGGIVRPTPGHVGDPRALAKGRVWMGQCAQLREA